MFKANRVNTLIKMSVAGLLSGITMACPITVEGKDGNQVTSFVDTVKSNNRESYNFKWRSDLKWFYDTKESKNRRVSPDITNDRIGLINLKFIYDNCVYAIGDRIRNSRVEDSNFLVDLLQRFIEGYEFDGNTVSFTGLLILTVEYLSYLKGKRTVIKFEELQLSSFCNGKSSISFADFKRCLISALSGNIFSSR